MFYTVKQIEEQKKGALGRQKPKYPSDELIYSIKFNTNDVIMQIFPGIQTLSHYFDVVLNAVFFLDFELYKI